MENASYSNRLYDFSVTISGCYKDVYVRTFFPLTVTLLNSLAEECFSLTYDLNDFEVASMEVSLYLHKSTIWSCMEYCCHIWVGAPSSYLEMLDKLQNWVCRTTLAHHQTVDSLSLFHRYYFARCSNELVELALLPYSNGRFTRYSDRLHYFSVTIPRCHKNLYVSSFWAGVIFNFILDKLQKTI